MNTMISICLAIVAIIHILPVVGVAGQTTLVRLYETNITDNNLLLLMQHRAMLFGIVALLCALGAVQQRYQGIAITVGLLSVCSYMYLVLVQNDVNESLWRVFHVDIAAFVLLLFAAALWVYQLRV